MYTTKPVYSDGCAKVSFTISKNGERTEIQPNKRRRWERKRT